MKKFICQRLKSFLLNNIVHKEAPHNTKFIKNRGFYVKGQYDRRRNDTDGS